MWPAKQGFSPKDIHHEIKHITYGLVKRMVIDGSLLTTVLSPVSDVSRNKNKETVQLGVYQSIHLNQRPLPEFTVLPRNDAKPRQVSTSILS